MTNGDSRGFKIPMSTRGDSSENYAQIGQGP